MSEIFLALGATGVAALLFAAVVAWAVMGGGLGHRRGLRRPALADQSPPVWLVHAAQWFLAIASAGILARMVVAWQGAEVAAELCLFIVIVELFRRQEAAR